MDELPKTHTHTKKGNCTVIFSFFLLWGGRCCVLLEKCWQLQKLNVFFPRFVTVFRPLFLQQPFLFAFFFIISRLFSGYLYIRDTTHKRSLRRYNRLRVELASSRVSYMGGARQNNCGWKKRKRKLLAFIHSGHRRTQQVFLLLLTNRLAFVGLGLWFFF